MQATATEAKNRFGYFCTQAKTEEVFIEKDGRLDSVILSYENFRALKDAAIVKSTTARKREFNETYKDWIADQNALIEKYGIPGEEFRPW